MNRLTRGRKARASGGGDCVWAGDTGDGIGICDTRLGEASPMLTVSRPDWRTFLDAIKELP